LQSLVVLIIKLITKLACVLTSINEQKINGFGITTQYIDLID